MRQLRIQLMGPGGGSGPQGGPGLLARLLFTVLAVIALVVSAFLGAIFFLVALGFFVVGTVVVAVRLWWIRRQLEAAMRAGERAGAPGRPPGGPRGDFIEGEYEVVDERREPGETDEDHGRGR